MSWLKSLFRLSPRARLVGSDLRGNQYYEAMSGGRRRPRRSVRLQGGQKQDAYSPDVVPPEWDRWLRGLSKDPPTLEEMEQRTRESLSMKQKVAIAELKDEQQRKHEEAEGSTSSRVKATEHASAPSFKSQSTVSSEPTSTGKTFEPASWKPQ